MKRYAIVLGAVLCLALPASADEAESKVAPASKGCTYAGQTYTEGAQVGGQECFCDSQGCYWR